MPNGDAKSRPTLADNMEALPMSEHKKLRERAEFPVAFILSTLAGLLAFLLVWLLGTAWELTAVTLR